METEYNNYLYRRSCKAVSCPICNASDYDTIENVIGAIPNYRVHIVRCTRCGHVELFMPDPF